MIELPIQIAAICLLATSPGAGFLNYRDVEGSQIECQKYYADCLLKSPMRDENFLKCMKERKNAWEKK